MTDLTTRTPEQLLAMCQPYLAKLLARIPLTEQEETEHSQIVREARRQHDALRASELAERAERDELMTKRATAHGTECCCNYCDPAERFA